MTNGKRIRTDFPGGGMYALLVHIGQHDARTFACEQQGVFLPYAAGSAGDQHYLAINSSHMFSPENDY
jgi:hypothetical protein